MTMRYALQVLFFSGFYDIIHVLNNEFPCHSEEQRDEESDCIFYEILTLLLRMTPEKDSYAFA